MADAHDAWWKEALWTVRFLLVLFDDVGIYVSKVVFNSCFDGESADLGVTEGAI